MPIPPRRKRMRKPFHDYASPADYFVTICIHQNRHLLGHIQNSQMILNAAGEMVVDTWMQMPIHNPGITLHAFVVMPNHFHGIVQINAIDCHEPISTETDLYPYKKTLGALIGSFKALTSKFYSKGVHQGRWPAYHKRFWQRDYHDHIIRDKSKFDQLTIYIRENPRSWHEDKYFS